MNRLFIALLCGLPLACAVPVPPTGGPPDREPPVLVATHPENGAIRFSGRDLEFTFNEAVDLRSFISAFSISPDFAGVPRISGSGKRIRVQLPEDPRPETTYIISIEATLRDVRSVSLDQPISIAFSTGDVIDAARMTGRVVRSLDGKPVSGMDVFAFASDDSTSLAGPPLYRTQTAKTGDFLFEHVAEGPYFVVAVQDANRNRTLDAGESFGVPPVHFLVADSVGAAPDVPWIMARHDNEAPVLERVRVLSARDLELRFSEPLDLDLNKSGAFTRPDRSIMAIWDSLGSAVSSVRFHYPESRPRAVFARVDSLPVGSYALRGMAAVQDSSYNVSAEISADFSVSASLSPSEKPAFMMWTPDSSVVSATSSRTIWPYESLGFRTTKPADAVYASSLRDTLAPAFAAVIRDTTGMSFPARFSQVEPAFFVLEKTGSFSFNAPFYLDVNQKDFGGPDSVVTGLFEYASMRKLGSVSVVVVSGDRAENHVLQIEGFDRSQALRAFVRTSKRIGPEESVVLDHLPGGKAIQLRLTLTGNETSNRPVSSWWPGALMPWSPPDPIAWIEFEEPVRARWETALPDTVDFRNWPLRPAVPDSSNTP